MPTGKVLVVEDSPVQADRIGEVLRGAGYDVTFASDRSSAQTQLVASPPDLLLLSMVLDDGSGADVLRFRKVLPRHLFVPAIILSAQSDLAARLKGLRLGAEDYLGKDAHPEEILARVATMLRIKQLQDDLRDANEKLELLSVTDGLTGLYNHRAFQTRLREEFGRAARYGGPLSLVMIDLDHFKAINDTWLHPFGDKVLRETAILIRNSLRDHDVSARYGGEEFAVLLPHTPFASALPVARRIARAIAGHLFVVDADEPGSQGPEVSVTASFGVAAFPGGDVTTPETLVRRADEALFRAKRAGRDRIWAYGGDGEFREDAEPEASASPPPA
ncbi:MAG: diguanylate cyclase [Deltaproteobacteria bacterium]|nr:diguanylate cyclase [Deltaproteobacteria bacterium]